MLSPKNKWIQNLINCEPDARQIRSNKNKVIAENKMGKILFGSDKNPFDFLSDTLQPERLEKLQNAYEKKCPVCVRLETAEKTFEVSIRLLPKAVLLCAQDLSEKIQMEELLKQVILKSI